MVKRIYIVAPAGHSNLMKPPIINIFKLRSSSLKNERNTSKVLIEKNPTNDFNYRRKMIKYQLLRKYLEKDKREGLSLINFPKVVL